MYGHSISPILSYHQEDFVTPGTCPLQASSLNVIRETPNFLRYALDLPVAEQRLRILTALELRGSLASFRWAEKKSSSLVLGSAMMALRAALFTAYLLTMRMRFKLR